MPFQDSKEGQTHSYGDGCGDPDCDSCNKNEWYEEKLNEVTVIAVSEALTHGRTKPISVNASYITTKLKIGITELIAEATRRRDEEIRGMIEAEKKVWTGLFDVPLKAPCDALDHILIHLRD